MHLQLLDFDCTEDADGVVCWDALAHPAAEHNPALLNEVSEVLAWANALAPQGPAALEDGAPWDFDLQAIRHAPGHSPVPAQLSWTAQTGLNMPAPLCPEERLELSLTLSGTPAFAQAFRDQWGVP